MPDCVAKREGFESSLQVLARTTVGNYRFSDHTRYRQRLAVAPGCQTLLNVIAFDSSGRHSGC